LRNVWLRLARAERLVPCEGLAVLVAVLEAVVAAQLELWIVAALGARLEVRILLAELLLRRGDQAKIMLGMLEIVFGRNRIAGRLGVTRKLEVFLRHVIGGAANFHVRTVRLIHP